MSRLGYVKAQYNVNHVETEGLPQGLHFSLKGQEMAYGRHNGFEAVTCDII